MVPCAWDECNVKVPRSASQLKNLKRAFCRPDHYFLKLRKEAHEAKEAARRASPSLSIQIAVALTTLVIGLSVGWSATTTDHPNLSSILSDDYAQYGPLARLSGGL